MSGILESKICRFFCNRLQKKPLSHVGTAAFSFRKYSIVCSSFSGQRKERGAAGAGTGRTLSRFSFRCARPARQPGLTRPLHDNYVSYRGTRRMPPFLKAILKDGEAWDTAKGLLISTDEAFTSTFLRAEIAESFLNSDGVTIKYYLPAGSKSVLYLDAIETSNRTEAEMLILPGTKMKVLNMDEENRIISLLVLD